MKFLIVGIIGFYLSWPSKTQAGFLDSVGCVASGNCGLADVELAFQALTNWLIGGIGALALLYFIWGAVQWITSSGRSDKVEHGKQIMINSVIALVIALGSFLLVQFFINDVLLGGDQTSEFRVASECVGANQGRICNQPWANYVCTGTFTDAAKTKYNELCVTRCELDSILANNNWTCINRSVIDGYTGIESTNNCPTETQVCVNVATLPPGLSGYTGSEPVNNNADSAGCCVRGPGECSEAADAASCQTQGGQFFSRTCAETNICSPGMVNQEYGCCVSNASPTTCEEVGYGDICDPNESTLRAYRHCTELDYCE